MRVEHLNLGVFSCSVRILLYVGFVFFQITYGSLNCDLSLHAASARGAVLNYLLFVNFERCCLSYILRSYFDDWKSFRFRSAFQQRKQRTSDVVHGGTPAFWELEQNTAHRKIYVENLKCKCSQETTQQRSSVLKLKSPAPPFIPLKRFKPLFGEGRSQKH